MTSEIRANTLKNRVGLGTVEYTNTGIIVSGIVTANSFSGPLITTSIDLNGDLDVDGHTNLDNVSIAGVVTATSFVGNLTGTASGNPTLTNGADNRVITAASANTLNGEANLTFNGSKLHLAANSTAYDAFQVGDGLFIGNTTNNVSAAIFHQGGGADLEIGAQDMITFTTGSTAGNATTRFGIRSDGKVLMDNSTGTFTIGGDNVYDSAKINLMIGNSSQTSATTEATAIVIHDQNSRRNGTESAGSWKSKIVFRSTQINGNYQSEGASIVHDITYNNYSSTKMRSDLVFKTRGDAQTAASDAATEKLRINHSGKVIIGASSVSPATSYTDNLVVSEATANAGIQIVGNNSNSNFATIGLGDAGGNLRSYLEAQLGANGNFTIGTAGSGPIRFVNSGGEKFRIDGNGNFGFGDTGPTNFTNYTNLSIHGSSGGAITFGDDGTDEWEIYGGDGALRVYDRANTSERFRITDSGTVSINEGSPSSSFKLHVNGMGRFTDNVNLYDGKLLYFGDSDTAFVQGYDVAAGGYLSLGANNEKVRINANGDNAYLKIVDNNTSSSGNHGFRFGSWGIQMRDTGGYNHWYIRRNYGGWQSSPQVTFKGNGYTGVGRLDPTHTLDVDGTSIFRDRLFSGTMSMKSVPFGANVVYDTGISINGYGYGGSILALCSRNYGAGTSTQAGLYYLEFKYDGNHIPTVHHVSGDTFVTFGKSASNTLTVTMGASNNVITMIESSVVNP